MGNRRRSGNPAAQAWQPLTRGEMNPELLAALAATDPTFTKADAASMEVWANAIYEVVVRHKPDGITHLSIKRYTRQAVRDWRHLQQIKNEICGPEREAVELFPAESRLTDLANEAHLWVLPEGERFPFGWPTRAVSTDAQLERFNQGRERGDHKGRQRPWQPGLTTGRSDP